MTEHHGLPEWTEDDIIFFQSGIPGFENCKRFIIISVPEYDPFHWLQCVDGDKIRFAIINPMVFEPTYEPKIRKEELGTLNIKSPKDLLSYVIVTLKSPLSDSTANLMGPVFINIKEKLGKQIILDDGKYSLREKIIKE